MTHQTTERRRGARAVISDPTSARLLAAQTVSDIGDFIGLAALLLLAFHNSGSVVASAGIFAARSLPSLAIGTVCSGWLDVPPRRKALIWLTIVGASVTTVVAVFPTTIVAMGVAAILGATRTATSSINAGAAVDGLNPDVRASFYAISSSVNQATQLIGFVAGATTVLLVGVRAALVFDIATYLAALVVLRGLPVIASRPRRKRPSPFHGIRIIGSTPVLSILMPVVWATVVATAVPETFAASLSHGAELPFLMAAFPLGSCVMGAVVARFRLLDDLLGQFALALVFAGGFLLGALALSVGASRWYLVAATFVAGVGNTWLVGARTTFALHTPGDHMAQVEATAVASNLMLEGLGVLALAAVAQRIGPAWSYAAAGILVAVAAATATAASPRRARADRPLSKWRSLTGVSS